MASPISPGGVPVSTKIFRWYCWAYLSRILCFTTCGGGTGLPCRSHSSRARCRLLACHQSKNFFIARKLRCGCLRCYVGGILVNRSSAVRQHSRSVVMKKALVCGAGGFIPSHPVTRLKRGGYWVPGGDIKRPQISPPAADDFQLPHLRAAGARRAARSPAPGGF